MGPPPAQRASAGPGEGQTTVALVGNPNSGKTTLFNRLTRSRQKVGNHPGTTVDRRTGLLDLDGRQVNLVDTPGVYSLFARSRDEEVTVEELLGLAGSPPPSAVILILDALTLERGLYLLTQLLDFNLPVVVAVNMMDQARDRGLKVECAQLEELFGAPFVPVVGRDGEGIEALGEAVARLLEGKMPIARPRSWQGADYPARIEGLSSFVAEVAPAGLRSDQRDAFAWWALMSADNDESLIVPEAIRERARAHRSRLREQGVDLELEAVGPRYRFIEERALPMIKPGPAKPTLTDRVDAVLTHPLWGGLVFTAVMLGIFQLLFRGSEPFMDAIEGGFTVLADAVRAQLPAGLFRDLLTDGIIAGVGGIVVFLPQILFLFFFLTLLESSGYMARAAFLVNRLMGLAGLSGRAFVPLMGGFACAIPAIMATRTMERERDRLLTMLVVPLISCAARLPVYALVIAALFPADRTVLGWISVGSLMLFGLYVFSTLVAWLASVVLGRTLFRGKRPQMVMELPPYRLPRLSAVLQTLWHKARAFLWTAGRVILVLSVVLWLLLTFPRLDPADTPTGLSDDQIAAMQVEQSYAGRLGHLMEPALEPLGFDWKIGIGLIGSFAAREVFVSTMGVVYGVGDGEETDSLREVMRADLRDDGTPLWTPLTGLSLLVFFMFAMQCMSTLAVARRESKGWRLPLFMLAYMTGLAYVASLLVYQGGRLLGF
ncbi:hypothetical protein ABI59_19035 [Acidobacteria bacterium Mor1]|nr:hypothetical protein ABI59_19035 [Acidobacteria bacterium Mor1]